MLFAVRGRQSPTNQETRKKHANYSEVFINNPLVQKEPKAFLLSWKTGLFFLTKKINAPSHSEVFKRVIHVVYVRIFLFNLMTL